MLEYLIVGGGFAFAAAAQPGPLQAFLLSRAAAQGWRRTLPAALSPLLSDVPIALLVLLAIGRLPGLAQQGLRAAGGILLMYLGWAAWREARIGPRAASSEDHSAPATLLQAALVNVLNPNPYLGWALVLGPAAITAWHRRPADAVVLVAAFYGTMVVSLAAFIVLAGTARLLKPRARRALILVSAVVLALLGVYQLAVGVRGVMTSA